MTVVIVKNYHELITYPQCHGTHRAQALIKRDELASAATPQLTTGICPRFLPSHISFFELRPIVLARTINHFLTAVQWLIPLLGISRLLCQLAANS